MPLSHSRARPSTFPAAAGLTALLLSCALLTGCGDPAAKADSDRNQALAAALSDYGSIATSHLSAAGGVPAGAYEDQLVLSKDKAWKPDLKALRPDLALLTARLDQYAALAKRFQELAADPAATPAQKAVAGATLSEIQRHRARHLLRRADLNRAALVRLVSGLEITLGKIENEALAQPVPLGHGVVALVEQGGAEGKIASLGDLTKARDAAQAQVAKLEGDVKAAADEKQALRAKADELYAKESELKVALRRAFGKEKFDLVDQASQARGEAEKAEALITGKDLALDLASRHLKLAAAGKVALEDAIAGYNAQRDSAQKGIEAASANTDETAKKIAEFHAQWIADAKAYDALFAAQVDAPLGEAAAAVQTAQDTLTKAVKDAGAAAGNLLPTLATDQAGMAVELAQTYSVRLRAQEGHKVSLRELAAREAAWLPGQTDPFIAERVAALTKAQAQAAKAGLAACGEADTAAAAALQANKGSDETKAALEGIQKNAADHRKLIKELSKDLPEAAPEAKPEEPKPEVKEEPKAEEPKPAEPKAEEPKVEEPKAEEPKPEAPAETPATN